MTEAPTPGALAGIKVLDLSRVLAGPWATQMLGDLGAEVLKIEQPGQGDDTRRWGPPALADDSGDSAYYLCANRNKRSLAIDLAQPEGADLIRRLAAESDVVVENFRVSGLAKYGLDYAALSAINPRLVYCSITGFGQDGPYKDKGGYDFLIQAMGGLMSVTGHPDDEPGGGPMKVGVPIVDLFTGTYATVAILAALRHRDATGQGQHIDCALLDTQLAMMSNQASNYLNGGAVPVRMGNDHPNIVPYRDYATADGEIVVALGNDRQFRDFLRVLGLKALGEDPRFASVALRSANRVALHASLAPAVARWRSDDLIAAMEAAKLPAGKVNGLPEILADVHVAHRATVQPMARQDGTPLKVVAFPAKLSATPARYDRAPPCAGADTRAVLGEALGLSDDAIDRLATTGVIPR
ncbi:CoA transferase [Sphingomonas sp. TF3]|uniref:CaiB/BaiF CoA transferase family protein n=1 Tax=Sphingomonas sp. TF3 TaxID=2495580 RepID=UPI000F875B17|nr:CaiB/BaiF CoA-transferase family protein [Sphingomonas sp. TF3]RUN78235.1 CoA transferase [Sphingomonas sp. TF3]